MYNFWMRWDNWFVKVLHEKQNFNLTEVKSILQFILRNASFPVQDVCQSTFLVININSVYKHTHEVGENH